MRHLKHAWIIVLFLTAGCSIFTPPGTIPVDQSLSPQMQQAQTAINEANVAIAAAAQTITDDVNSGVMGSAEAQGYQDQLNKARKTVKEAETLFVGGNALTAKSKAELVKTTLVLLRKELAAKQGGK